MLSGRNIEAVWTRTVTGLESATERGSEIRGVANARRYRETSLDILEDDEAMLQPLLRTYEI